MPPTTGEQPPDSSFNQALASAGEGGTQPAASYAPGFFGDLIGSTVLTVVSITPKGGSFAQPFTFKSPDVTNSGGLKIAESDSPRPTDRIYYNFNFYGGIAVNPDPTVPLLQVSRHEIGFEKTFFGGDASFGMRLPFFSFAGDPSYETVFTGDLVLLTKYAFINNRETGNVLSAGLVLTVPSGGSPSLLSGNNIREEVVRNYPVTIEPYFGYIYNVTNRLYLQGFHSVCVPTDPSEATFMSNDIGIGYYLFREPSAQFIRALVPTVEVHINTPFNHREEPVAVGDVQMLDSTNITTGFYLVLPRSTIGAAVGVPLVNGPEHIEALVNFTMHF
jgi:hypothetical protein